MMTNTTHAPEGAIDTEQTSTTPNPIKVCMSVSRKVNLGNYESGDVFLSLSDVPVGATQAQIEDALQTSKIVWDVLRTEVNKKAVALRENSGSGR